MIVNNKSIILIVCLCSVFISTVEAEYKWRIRPEPAQYFQIPWTGSGYIYNSQIEAWAVACAEWIKNAKAAGYTGDPNDGGACHNGFIDPQPYTTSCGCYQYYPSIYRGPFWPATDRSIDDPISCQSGTIFNEITGQCEIPPPPLLPPEKNLGSECEVDSGSGGPSILVGE